MKAPTLSRWDGQCGCAAAFSAAPKTQEPALPWEGALCPGGELLYPKLAELYGSGKETVV